MIGAKDILIKLKGDNKQFKGQMTGASTSMKGFATTTQTSTAVAATSTKVMALSMAASLAVATLGITVLIGGVMGLIGAVKKSAAASAEDQEMTAKTIALLEQQGIAWDSVGGHVLNYIEDLERLTTYGDTELQESFNEFVSAGMSVEEALKATSAAAAIAASGQMALGAATMVLRKEFTVGTSRLKNWGIEAESMDEILEQVTTKFGDGSQASETFSGKMKVLSNELMNALKPQMEELIPVAMDLLNAMIWGAKNVLPILIHMFKMLIIPIKFVIMNFTILINTAKAAWEALNGNFDVARAHLETNLDLAQQFNTETYNTILNIQEETVEAENLGTALNDNLVVQQDTVVAMDEQNEKTKEQLSLRERMSKIFERAPTPAPTPGVAAAPVAPPVVMPTHLVPTPSPAIQFIQDLLSGSRSGI